MQVLILGGSQFIGKHLAARLLAEGHAVTLFNRGQTAPNLFADAEHLIGDRNEDLTGVLGNRFWDAVVDVSGYLPAQVERSTRYLLDKTELYCFISSIAAYAQPQLNADETSPLHPSWPTPNQAVNSDNYGPYKADCERLVLRHFPLNHLIIRPTYVFGPDDPNDRFGYWLRRANQGGKLLLPGNAQQAIQYIDVRDLARFIALLLHKQQYGSFHAVGPKHPTNWGELVNALSQNLGSRCHPLWLSSAMQQRLKLAENELPLAATEVEAAYFSLNPEKALSQGLSFRPLADTIIDSWQWEQNFGQPKNGLEPKREQALIQQLQSS